MPLWRSNMLKLKLATLGLSFLFLYERKKEEEKRNKKEEELKKMADDEKKRKEEEKGQEGKKHRTGKTTNIVPLGRLNAAEFSATTKEKVSLGASQSK